MPRGLITGIAGHRRHRLDRFGASAQHFAVQFGRTARRGWAPDYVDALAGVTLSDRLDDYIVATGRSHSVRNPVQAAFLHIGTSEWIERVGSSESGLPTHYCALRTRSSNC